MCNPPMGCSADGTRLFSALPSESTRGDGHKLRQRVSILGDAPRHLAWPERPAPGKGAERPHLLPPDTAWGRRPSPHRGTVSPPRWAERSGAGPGWAAGALPSRAGRGRAQACRAAPNRAGPAMAIAHIATEYVFSDFLLKEPPETRFKGLRLELALDKIVTCIAVGLPLLLISLAFAQEVSIGNRPPRPAPPRLPAPPAADKGLGGVGERCGASERGGRGAGFLGVQLPDAGRGFHSGVGEKAPLGRGECAGGGAASRRASLAAGCASVQPCSGVLGIPAGLSRSAPCSPPPWGIP